MNRVLFIMTPGYITIRGINNSLPQFEVAFWVWFLSTRDEVAFWVWFLSTRDLFFYLWGMCIIMAVVWHSYYKRRRVDDRDTTGSLAGEGRYRYLSLLKLRYRYLPSPRSWIPLKGVIGHVKRQPWWYTCLINKRTNLLWTKTTPKMQPQIVEGCCLYLWWWYSRES